MTAVNEKQNDKKMKELPDGVWHTQGALIFYGIWRVDKTSIELTEPYVKILGEFNPLALEFLRKLADKMK